MKGGWFVGDFLPTAYNTKDFEVCYKFHEKNSKWDTHYHKLSIEITFLIRGQMTLQNKTLKTGDIFVMYPYEVANPVFLEDCELMVVKVPSVPGDKYIC